MVFYRGDWKLYSWLFNIYKHLQDDYDFLLIICGDTGTGKSRFALQLLESWYRVVLGREDFDESYIKNFNTKFDLWASNYKSLRPFEMNVFDEGSTALDSKEYMSVLSRNLSRMFSVIRYKRIFSVIVLPDFFSLNKSFRENRLRGLVHIHKRGRYRLFTKKGVLRLCGFNAKRTFKSLFVTSPLHLGSVPDYKGSLLKPYEEMSFKGKDGIIDDVVFEIESSKHSKRSLFDIYGKKIADLKRQGVSNRGVSKQLDISLGSVNMIVLELKKRQLIKV